MSDLIDRQAAIEALANGALINYQAAGHHNGLVKAIDVIKGLPSSVPERKTGRWIPQDWNEDSGMRRTLQNLPKCSICGFSAYHVYRYCPSCGSRMEGF